MMRGYWGFPGWENVGHHWSGAGIAGLVLMIILWAAVIAAIVIAIRALVIHSHRDRTAFAAGAAGSGASPAVTTGPRRARPDLLALLEERYAKGEITREDFLQRKADLGLGEPPASAG